ncbi:MAG: DUF86 domain-containing protein [Nanoarchaeota archaeon]
MRDYNLYLNDILRAIERIDNSFKGINEDDFNNDLNLQDATLMRIQIIGEAVKNIPDNLKEKYSTIEWKKISGIRDIISHLYFGIDLEIIWDVVKNKLPELKSSITNIINEEKKS